MAVVALIRPPTVAIATDLRQVKGDPIDFARAQEQHINYGVALRQAGAQIVVMPTMDQCPDAVFIEDTAFVVDGLAVIAHSTVRSRWIETASIAAVLSRFYYLVRLPDEAVFDGGDALAIGRTVYIGHCERTNLSAIKFLTTLLRENGYDVVPVPVSETVRLKDAVSYLGHNTVLINPNSVSPKVFSKYTQVLVERTEPLAANAMLIGDSLFVSASSPITLHHLLARGFKAQPLEVSEFHKAHSGVTRLSILANTRNVH